MIISIVNHKGGTGKTTTTHNLGVALGQLGYRVLLVDLDAQANLTFSVGVTPLVTIGDVLHGDVTFHEAIHRLQYIDLVPSENQLADVEISLAMAEDRYNQLAKLLSQVNGYDFILLDCPPSISLLNVNALVAANHVIIPMQMEVLSVKGLEQILNTIQTVTDSINPDLEVMGVLSVMMDSRKNLSKEIQQYIEDNITAVRLFKTSIRNSVKAAEAPSFGKSIVEYAPHSEIANDYKKFAEEVLKYCKQLALVNQ